MQTHLIVDGYNVIFALPELIKAKHKSLEFARYKLLELIAKYADKALLKATIVFDGKGSGASDYFLPREYSHVEVLFSRKGQSADMVIERLVHKNVGKETIVVVTGDRLTINLIFGMGATHVSPKSLLEQVKSKK